MKIALLITDGARQIMFTPETDHEKELLKMIQPHDKLVAVTKWGNFTHEEKIVGVSVDKSMAGYYRAYPDSESLMFIIEDKNAKDHETG